MAKGEVRYRLVLDSKAFVDGIKAAKNEANAMANDMAGKLGKAGNILSAMGPAGFAAAAGIGAFVAAGTAAVKITIDATTQAMKYGDAMAALQDKTGLSTKALQDLEIAAKLGNSSLDAIAGAVNKMQKGLVENSQAFTNLGLSIGNLKKMSPEEQFRAVAKSIESIEDPATKAAYRVAIFGKTGNDLAGTLKAAASSATQLGGALSEDALQAAADLQDQADLLDSAWDRVVLQFGAAVAQSPELKRLLDDITQALVKMAEKIADLAPKIASLFDKMTIGARIAVAAILRLGTQGAIGGGFGAFKSDVEQIFLDAQFGDVTGGGSSSGLKPKKPPPPNLKPGKGPDKLKTGGFFGALFGTPQMLQPNFGVQNLGAPGIKGLTSDMKADFLGGSSPVLAIQAARKATIDWRSSLMDVANAFSSLQGKAAQGLGAIAGGIATIGQMQKQLSTSVDAGGLKGAGGIGGLLGKVGAGLGIAGAAISIGGTIIGGIKSLFGGKSKEEKAAEEKARQEKISGTIDKMADALERISQIKMEKLQSGVGGLAALFSNLASKAALTPAEIDRINARMSKYKEKLKDTGLTEDEYNKKIKERRKELEHAMGESDIEAMKGRMERLGIIGAAMFESLKKEGMSTVEAMREMGPALDEALKAAADHGIEIGGTLGVLAQFREKVLANEGLVNAAEGLSSVMDALRSTGGLNATTFGALRDEMHDVFSDLQEGGFTSAEALSLIAPTLLQIRDAARDGRIQIDEQTQALIDQAEAGGHLDNIKDPMEELVETQKMMLELWSAIAQMQGVTLPESLRKYLDEIKNVGNAVGSLPGVGGGSVPVPGGIQGKFEGDDVVHAASGFYSPSMGHGPLKGGGTPMVVHPGEGVHVQPGGFGGMSMGPIVLEADGRELGRVHIGQMRKNGGGLRSQSRRYVR